MPRFKITAPFLIQLEVEVEADIEVEAIEQVRSFIPHMTREKFVAALAVDDTFTITNAPDGELYKVEAADDPKEG